MGYLNSIDTTKTQSNYGILCQPLGPDKLVPPFHPTFCIVPAEGKTAAHEHFETEMFVILEGQGTMQLGDETFPVKTGDTIFIPPFTNHTLSAPAHQPVKFLSVYSAGAAAEPLPRQTLVAAAPPTPNGALHLGHLSGPYTAADALARYLRQRGVGCHSLCGTDDNQPYIEIQARKEGTSIPALLEKYQTAIRKGLQMAGIRHDRFITPATDESYRAHVQNFFSQQVAAGIFVEKEIPVPYYAGTALTDPQVAGFCPDCDKSTLGNGCEECGSVFPVASLRSPTLAGTGEPIQFRTERRLSMPLEPYRVFLRHYHSVARTTVLRRFLDATLIRPLPDLEVVFASEAGIPAPGFPGFSINPWIEMAAGYLYELDAAARLSGQTGADFVPAFGFDNVFYYSIVFPALFQAIGRPDALPKYFLTNEFYHLDGRKFSTSRKHALWVLETLAALDPDMVRFHLALHRPESSNTEFRFQDFHRTIDEFFVPLNDVLAECQIAVDTAVNNGGKIALTTNTFGGEARQLWSALARAIGQVEIAYHPATFSLRTAASTVAELVRTFGPACRHLPESDRAVVTIAFARSLARMLHPICPRLTTQIAAALSSGTGSGTGSDLKWDSEPRLQPVQRQPQRLPRIDLESARATTRRMEKEFRK